MKLVRFPSKQKAYDNVISHIKNKSDYKSIKKRYTPRGYYNGGISQYNRYFDIQEVENYIRRYKKEGLSMTRNMTIDIYDSNDPTTAINVENYIMLAIEMVHAYESRKNIKSIINQI